MKLTEKVSQEQVITMEAQKPTGNRIASQKSIGCSL